MVEATGPEELMALWLRKNVTLLNEALDASETGIDVDDGTLFVAGDVIQVESEQMLVGSVSSNTLTVTRAHNSTTAATHADNSEVGLYKRRRFKLSRPIQPQAVDNFPGKVTIGAYNIDSNDILSAWVISDLSGGHGVADLQEGVTDNRYRFGNIYTRFTSQWTKPFLATETVLGTSACLYLGDVNDGGTVKRIVIDSTAEDLYENTTNIGTIGTSIYNRRTSVDFGGTASQNLFYVGRGTAGYTTYNPVAGTITNNNVGAGHEKLGAFTIWDEKLIAIDTDGVMYYATTAAADTAFTAYTLGGNNVKLDSALGQPLGLSTFVNKNGDSTVYIITRHHVLAFDADTPRIYQIPDFGSHHPRFGTAWAVWRGVLYVSSGMDIIAFDGETIRFTTSLSRDDGLPYAYQGYVLQMVPGQNALYATVLGLTSGGLTTSSVHEWSGFGWHCIWTSTQSAYIVSISVSSAAGGYDLIWGMSSGGLTYTMPLPVSFTNPREAIDNSAASFGTAWVTPANNTHFLETGKFDANMKGYRKIANAVELDVRTMPTNNSIVLKYRIDEETSWTTMYHTDGGAPSGTTVTTTGHHQFEFGPYDPDGSYVGIDFESIEFRLEFVDTATNSTTPAVTSMVFSFLKIMNPSLAWTTEIDLYDDYYDASPQVLLDELTELRTLPRFFSIKHRATVYRARMSGMQTSEEGGNDERATARISWIEIPGVLGLEDD